MKYGNISFSGRQFTNLGDIALIHIVDQIYKEMGITDIVYIDYRELDTYQNSFEEIVLPICFPLIAYHTGGICKMISECIRPIFLGLSIPRQWLSSEEVVYLKKYEPIGCRDEITYNTIRKYNIECWLNGCMTIAMSPMDNWRRVTPDRIIAVDVPSYLRSRLLNVYKGKTVDFFSNEICEEDPEQIKDKMLERYRFYYENAAIIVTARLHCASPAIGMGIPTVFVPAKNTIRFAWFDKIVKVYCYDEMDNIDWYPRVVDITYIKEKILQNAKRIIGFEKESFNYMSEISRYYLDREKPNHYYAEGFDDAVEYLNRFSNSSDSFLYAIWGLTDLSEMIFKYISDEFPNAKLKYVFDSYRRVEFHGCLSIDISEIKNDDLEGVCIFVTAFSATDFAKKWFNDKCIRDYCLCYDYWYSTLH